jgi:hypothetical protein
MVESLSKHTSPRWHELEGLSVGGESTTTNRRSECNVKAHHIPTVLYLPACFSCEARSLPVVCMPGRRASRVLPPVPSASVFCAALHARAHRSGIFRPSPVSLASSCPLGGADTQMRRQLCSTVVHIGVDNRNLVLSKGGAKREKAAPTSLPVLSVGQAT